MSFRPFFHLTAFLATLLATLLATFFSGAACANPFVDQEITVAPNLPQTIDLTEHAPDLWARIRNGFAMPDLNDELVIRHQRYYQAHPEALRRMVERSRPYLHHVVEMLEMRGMPMELALLPMVESAYNPLAHSQAQAAGLWQFIPSTGRLFDLEQNWWRDQRRDVVASTRAALDYLQYVYEMMGDWHLALSAYNWGEGSVGRMVARNHAKNLPADYLSINMPKETRHYVPKLQALKNIFADPALLAELRIPSLPNEAHFKTLTLETPIDFSLAARLADMSIADFFALNSEHNRPVILPRSTLVIPAERLESFQEGLRQYAEHLSWGAYSPRSGESLADIAERFGIRPDDLKRINGLVGEAHEVRLTPDMTLLVPVNNSNKGKDKGKDNANGDTGRDARLRALDDKAFLALAKQGAQTPLLQARFHQVRKGDTLSGIARHYRISVADLKRLNRLGKNQIRAGTRLAVSTDARSVPASGQYPALFSLNSLYPGATQPAPSSQPARLGDLAAEAEEMEEADSGADEDAPLADPAPRYVASVTPATPELSVSRAVSRSIPANAEAAQTQTTLPTAQDAKKPAGGTLRHTIRKGDTLFSIAQTYRVSVEVLKAANQLRGNMLRTGSVLAIPDSKNSNNGI